LLTYRFFEISKLELIKSPVNKQELVLARTTLPDFTQTILEKIFSTFCAHKTGYSPRRSQRTRRKI